MTPQRYERLRRLFVVTCDLAPAQRKPVLERLCPDDPALRRLAERLVRLDARFQRRGSGRGV